MTRDVDEFTAYVQARMEHWRRTAYLLSRDWHAADDLVAILAGKLYRHWRRLHALPHLDAYAQRMLTRVWLDETRRPWRRERAAADLPEIPATPGRRIEERDALWRLLGALGPRQRAVLVLRFYLDFSVEETADALGISTGTVKSQCARGLETLRALIGQSEVSR